eukprot:3513093-Alexandrium_andersonii.AAC.1
MPCRAPCAEGIPATMAPQRATTSYNNHRPIAPTPCDGASAGHLWRPPSRAARAGCQRRAPKTPRASSA